MHRSHLPRFLSISLFMKSRSGWTSSPSYAKNSRHSLKAFRRYLYSATEAPTRSCRNSESSSSTGRLSTATTVSFVGQNQCTCGAKCSRALGHVRDIGEHRVHHPYVFKRIKRVDLSSPGTSILAELLNNAFQSGPSPRNLCSQQSYYEGSVLHYLYLEVTQVNVL